MDYQQAVSESRERKIVPDDKFDSHMKKARTDDIDSRKAIFTRQTEEHSDKAKERREIQNSVY